MNNTNNADIIKIISISWENDDSRRTFLVDYFADMNDGEINEAFGDCKNECEILEKIKRWEFACNGDDFGYGQTSGNCITTIEHGAIVDGCLVCSTCAAKIRRSEG